MSMSMSMCACIVLFQNHNNNNNQSHFCCVQSTTPFSLCVCACASVLAHLLTSFPYMVEDVLNRFKHPTTVKFTLFVCVCVQFQSRWIGYTEHTRTQHDPTADGQQKVDLRRPSSLSPWPQWILCGIMQSLS